MTRTHLTGTAAALLLAAGLAGCGGGSSSENEQAPPAENGPIAYMTDGMEVFELNEDGSGRHRLIPNALDFGVSPDGSKLAYVANVLDPAIDDYVPRLWESDADGKHKRRLAGDLAVQSIDAHPDFAPDGKTIVFTGVKDDDDHIFSIQTDGSGLKQLTTGTDGDPDFSPDGKQIVFVRFNMAVEDSDEDSLQLPEVFDLFVMNADGSDQRKLVAGSSPAWSPDGTQIAYLGLGGIAVVKPDGSDPHQLVGLASDPAWSPDGKKLAYSAGEVGEPSNGLYVLTVDSGKKTHLVHTGFSSVRGVSWEPRRAH